MHTRVRHDEIQEMMLGDITFKTVLQISERSNNYQEPECIFLYISTCTFREKFRELTIAWYVKETI